MASSTMMQLHRAPSTHHSIARLTPYTDIPIWLFLLLIHDPSPRKRKRATKKNPTPAESSKGAFRFPLRAIECLPCVRVLPGGYLALGGGTGTVAEKAPAGPAGTAAMAPAEAIHRWRIGDTPITAAASNSVQ